MRLIIDKIEGDYATVELEDGTTVDIPTLILPSGVREGDIMEIRKNEEETVARKWKIEKLMKNLWED